MQIMFLRVKYLQDKNNLKVRKYDLGNFVCKLCLGGYVFVFCYNNWLIVHYCEMCR